MKRSRKRSSGFTLIEIIAVLVILGILAAVAVPKYVSLQADARKQALQGAVAAAKSALSMAYAKYVLNLQTEPTADQLDGYDNIPTNCGVDQGDFTVSCAAQADGSILITVSDATGVSDTGTYKLP